MDKTPQNPDEDLNRDDLQKKKGINIKIGNTPKKKYGELKPWEELFGYYCCKNICTKDLLQRFDYYRHLRSQARISQIKKRQAAAELLNSRNSYVGYCNNFITRVIGISRTTLTDVKKKLNEPILPTRIQSTENANIQISNEDGYNSLVSDSFFTNQGSTNNPAINLNYVNIPPIGIQSTQKSNLSHINEIGVNFMPTNSIFTNRGLFDNQAIEFNNVNIQSTYGSGMRWEH